MIEMSLRTFIIKVLVFILIKPPFGVYTQQLNVPKSIMANVCTIYQQLLLQNFI